MYKVPIIPPDLRHEETIIQAANALDCLQKTINSVFEKIDSRIADNNNKLKELDGRIGKAQRKIQSIVGSKKAIKIYVPSRFPASQSFRDIPQTFSGMTMTAQEKNIKSYEVKSRLELPTAQTVNEKLVFFHVRSAETLSEDKLTAAKVETNQQHDLGNVPENCRSVNSLLRFNTDECVYNFGGEENDYVSWKRAKLFKNQRQLRPTNSSTQKQILEPAPHSLAHPNQKLTPADGLRYMPKLNEAPTIDVPFDLPDLPGIADDIHFEGKAQQQIAPSCAFIEQLSDLPDLSDFSDLPELPELPGIAEDMHLLDKEKQITTESITSISNQLRDESKEQEQQLKHANHQTISNAIEQKRVQITTVSQLPPPPPPPPPPAPTITSTASKPILEKANAPSTEGKRSELMDAIRKAGGASGGRLRAAAAAPIEVVDNTKTKTKEISGGNLMADLHNKLLMRRKGISGSAEKSNERTTSATSLLNNPVMSRLSALIPPPLPKTRQQQSDDEDEESNNDWND